MATEVETRLDAVHVDEDLPELDGIGIHPSPPIPPERITEIEPKSSNNATPTTTTESSTSILVQDKEAQLPKLDDIHPLDPEISDEQMPPSESSSDKTNDEDKPKTTPTTSTFIQDEAALNLFLEESRPKPKKLTIKEMLQNLPGYDKISQMRPTLGGIGSGTRINPKAMINLSESDEKRVNDKLNDKLEALLERFAKHAAAGVGGGHGPENGDSKPQHYKIHVNKLEKDSQGELHAIVDEIDYVATPPDEEAMDIIANVNRTTGASPREQVPGEKMYRLKKALWASIRTKKAKDYEERMKRHAMYSEEKDILDKADEEELPDDEIIEDEEEEEDDDDDVVDDDDLTDSEEEEELDEYGEDGDGVPKDKQKKKKRRRIIFVDDEAEDEDEVRIMSSSEEEEEGDDKEIKVDDNLQEQSSKIVVEEVADSQKISQPQLSYDGFEESQPEPPPPVTVMGPQIDDLMAKTGRAIEIKELDLFNLCSGAFPSQPECTPLQQSSESQTKVDCFGFDEDDDEEELLDINAENNVETQNNKVEETNNTLSETTTDITCNDNDNNDSNKIDPDIVAVVEEDEEEEELIRSAKKIKPKRLHFSDDEEEEEEADNKHETVDEADDILEPDNEFEDEITEQGDDFDDEDDEEDEEAEYERQLVLQKQQETTPKPRGLFGKNGQLRRKFVEAEAELSGSDDGSEDEDEAGMNFYEKEEGDDDEMDQEIVRNQLERAHLKHLLDKDDDEIRELQEQYLERGDLGEGKQRERKFRWSDVDGGWADEKANMGDSDGGEEEESAEELARKIAEIEKRKWMHENSQILEASEEESQKLLFENSKFLKLGKSTRKKIDTFVESSSSSSVFAVINESSNTGGGGIPADFSISSLVKSKFQNTPKSFLAFNPNKDGGGGTDKDEEDTIKLSRTSSSQLMFASPDEPTSKFKRGSFLSRGSPSLSHLAEITKVNDGRSTNVKNNSRNFVFSVITPPEQASKQNKTAKRPANSQGTDQPKKFVKIDRSFSNLDDSSKDASVFKWM